MSDELSVSAYVVLGLIARHGPQTPYELKATLSRSIGYYWPIPHAQLYRYPPRLAESGLLEERLEEFGRRRRVFHLTDAGRAALESWLGNVRGREPETRDPAAVMLGLADLAERDHVPELAREQANTHRRWLALYQERLATLDREEVDGLSRSRMMKFGIAISTAYAEYWESLAAEAPPANHGEPGS